VQTIWKYEIAIEDEQVVEMPNRASLLAVATMNSKLLLWALVEPGNPKLPRRILVRGTGHPADGCNKLNHIGTIQVANLGLVWHVFDGGYA
jgi:hypothetical protein